MAGIRGALLVLLLVAGGASGQMAQEVSEAGKRSLATFSGDPQVHLKITVRMYNFGVARSTLTSAEGKATVILNQAGLEVAWVDCPLTRAEFASYPACQSRLGLTDFAVKLLTAGEAGQFPSHHEALGRAMPCPRNAVGCTAYIFYRNVLEVAGDGLADKSQVLGHAIVHEIGHLLLGPNSHTANGIMRGRWDEQNLQTIAKGHLAFSEAQSKHIREEIQERDSASSFGKDPAAIEHNL